MSRLMILLLHVPQRMTGGATKCCKKHQNQENRYLYVYQGRRTMKITQPIILTFDVAYIDSTIKQHRQVVLQLTRIMYDTISYCSI